MQNSLGGDVKAQVRVKTINTLLNSGLDLKLLNDEDISSIWETIFFALWYAEMGRGCEEIIAAVERACSANYKLTKIGFITIAKKWYGLDQYRVDKVSHLARHLLPVLLKHQISLWMKSCRKSKKLGTRDVYCRQLLKRTLNDVISSYGLCYFLLEITAEEVSKVLKLTYEKLNITVGKFELKADLIIFIYRQLISFASNMKLDSRLLRSFDQYVFKKLVEEVLPNESQLTQILVSLRIYQTLEMFEKRKKNPLTGKSRELIKRWARLIRDVHEKCINGEHFPVSIIPIHDTIRLKPEQPV